LAMITDESSRGSAEIRVIGTVRVGKGWSAVGGEQVEGSGAVLGGGSGVGPDGV
jgi:hypothetical protein